MKAVMINNLTTVTKEKTNYTFLVSICVLFSVLFFLRAINNFFFYVIVLLSLAVFICCRIQYCFPLLCFFMPFATILKANAGSISFFTILFFVLMARLVLKYKYIDAKLLIVLLVFFLYNLIFSSFGQLTTSITMLSGVIIMYYIGKEHINAVETVIIFSAGITIASLLALLKDHFPILNTFVTDSMMKLGDGSYALRFSGLQGNPNYYTLDIIVAISAIVVLLNNSVKPKIPLICFVIILSVFGFMSVSKSFLVTWGLMMILWLAVLLKKNFIQALKFIIIAGVALIIFYIVASEYIDLYISRILEDIGGSLDDITTGRLSIWIDYIKAIFQDLKILFMGNGLNTILESVGKGTHNTFLESIFYLGIFGSLLLLSLLWLSGGKLLFNKIIWLPLVVIVVRMIAIGILTYDNFWIYFAIYIVLTKNIQEKQQ